MVIVQTQMCALFDTCFWNWTNSNKMINLWDTTFFLEFTYRLHRRKKNQSCNLLLGGYDRNNINKFELEHLLFSIKFLWFTYQKWKEILWWLWLELNWFHFYQHMHLRWFSIFTSLLSSNWMSVLIERMFITIGRRWFHKNHIANIKL